MTIKVKKNVNGKQKVVYKTNKFVLTSRDIKEADKFDTELDLTINKIEKVLIELNALTKGGEKKDPELVWYTVGSYINEFLRENIVSKEDEQLFWESLYGRSKLLQKDKPRGKVGMTRNDFLSASLMAKFPYNLVQKVGPWAMWREILSYKALTKDPRLLDWLIEKLIKLNLTRDAARPLLMQLATRFKRLDTSVLSNWELIQKLKDTDLKNTKD